MGVIAGIAGAALMVGGTAMSAGRRTRVPEIRRVDTEREQREAIRQNIASIAPAAELSRKATEADQATLESQLRRAIPGYDQLIGQASRNIGASLRGELTPEVTSQVQRSTAGRALMGGYGGGSGFGRALTARDLGLTSLNLQQQGLGQAMNFIQNQRSTGMVQPFSVSSMFVSPTQRINLALQENSMQFNRDVMAAQEAAKPNPMMAAIGGSFSNIGGMMFGDFMGGRQQQQQTPTSYNPMSMPSPGGSYSSSPYAISAPGTVSYGAGLYGGGAYNGFSSPRPQMNYALPPGMNRDEVSMMYGG
jgi:hypothetical protein